MKALPKLPASAQCSTLGDSDRPLKAMYFIGSRAHWQRRVSETVQDFLFLLFSLKDLMRLLIFFPRVSMLTDINFCKVAKLMSFSCFREEGGDCLLMYLANCLQSFSKVSSNFHLTTPDCDYVVEVTRIKAAARVKSISYPRPHLSSQACEWAKILKPPLKRMPGLRNFCFWHHLNFKEYIVSALVKEYANVSQG